MYFKSYQDLIKYIDGLNIYGGWKINDGLMNKRGEYVRNKGYVNELRDVFNNKSLFYKSVAISEIVTWLDNFVHLRRVFKELRKIVDGQLLNRTEIVFEYVIEMSKLSRVDVIIKHGDNLCLVEFSLVNSFNRMKRAYQQKRIELMIYKDLMYNYVPSSYFICVLPFISLFEYKEKSILRKHVDSNIKQAKFAAEYIAKYVINKKTR